MKPLAKRLLLAAPLILLIAAPIWEICLYFCHIPLPPIGTYVALLAFWATVVTIWPPEGRWPKAWWVILFAVLLCFEVQNLYRDRAQHDREQNQARRREDNRFADILKRNQDQFDATMNSMKGLWSEITGGNSYIYFDLGFVGRPIEIEIPGAHKGEIVTNGFLKFVGTYPLHDVFVAAFGPKGWLPPIDYGTIFPNELGRPRQTLMLTFLPDTPKQRFDLFISTSNGSYSQNIRFLKVGDNWLWASRCYKYGVKTPLRVWAASRFPKPQLNVDW